MNKSTLAFHFEQNIDINNRFKAFRSATLSMLQAIIKHAESTYYTQPMTSPYSLTNPDPDPLARGSLPPLTLVVASTVMGLRRDPMILLVLATESQLDPITYAILYITYLRQLRHCSTLSLPLSPALS